MLKGPEHKNAWYIPLLIPVATTDLPSTPVEGMIVYDATDNKLKVYTGAAWETVVSAA